MDPEIAFQDAKDNFAIENFQECLKILHSIPVVPAEMREQVDLLSYRAYIAQKKTNVVVNEIPETHELIEYRLVLLLAKQRAGTLPKANIIDQLNVTLSENINVTDATPLMVAATIYMNMEMPEKALKILHQGTDMMCDAMSVHCLIMMNRFDLAGKLVRRMQTKNEDCLASQLASAEYCLTQGGDKLKEAFNVYQELQENHKASPLLLNGQACALIAMGKHADAEQLIRQALDIDPNHSGSLLNMLAISMHTGKPVETLSRFISQVRDCEKNHPFLASLDHLDNTFKELSQSFAPSSLS